MDLTRAKPYPRHIGLSNSLLLPQVSAERDTGDKVPLMSQHTVQGVVSFGALSFRTGSGGDILIVSPSSGMRRWSSLEDPT